MERPAGWIEDSLAGKPAFEFRRAETDALNDAVAGYGILPSKGFVLGALAGGGLRIQAAIHATTDADLERAALVHHRKAGDARIISIRDVMEIVKRDIEAHFASIRATIASAA